MPATIGLAASGRLVERIIDSVRVTATAVALCLISLVCGRFDPAMAQPEAATTEALI
jgi:hypothetical protein